MTHFTILFEHYRLVSGILHGYKLIGFNRKNDLSSNISKQMW